MLVLLDNGTAEYSFITAFFSSPDALTSSSSRTGNDARDSNSLLLSPGLLPSPLRSEFEDIRSVGGSEMPTTPKRRVTSFGSAISFATSPGERPANGSEAKDEEHVMTAIWKQVLDPVLAYCEVILTSTRSPHR